MRLLLGTLAHAICVQLRTAVLVLFARRFQRLARRWLANRPGDWSDDVAAFLKTVYGRHG